MVRSFRMDGRKHYGTSSSRLRHDHVRRQSCNTAIAGFALAAERRVGDQSQDGRQVAEAGDGRGFEDRPEGAALDGSDRGRGGDDRRLSTAHAAAAGRLPLRSAALDPAPDALGATSVPAAAWHLPPAGRRGGKAQTTEVQALRDRVLSYRYCRGSDLRGQALPVRRHRPDQQVCRDPTRREGRPKDGLGVPPAHARSIRLRLILSGPYDPHGQRHPVRRAAPEPEHHLFPANTL